jgi:hypothetical protein
LPHLYGGALGLHHGDNMAYRAAHPRDVSLMIRFPAAVM